MDYGEIFSKAWKIIWKYKILWLFGIFASCSGGGGNGGGGGINSGVQFSGNDYGYSNNLNYIEPWAIALIIAAVILLVVIVVGRTEKEAYADATQIVQAAVHAHAEPVERVYAVNVERDDHFALPKYFKHTQKFINIVYDGLKNKRRFFVSLQMR